MDSNADQDEGRADRGYDDEVLCAGWATVPMVGSTGETLPAPAGVVNAETVDTTDFMARLYQAQGMVGR